MTPPHTPESLLALTKSPEGLEEMRIIAAEFDGNERQVRCEVWWNKALGKHFLSHELPNYPTSLDAIFAAEERLGLHDDEDLSNQWLFFVEKIQRIRGISDPYRAKTAFFPPPVRLIPFILTAQWKEQNQ